MTDRPDIPEEAVEAVVSAIAKESFWDAKAPEVRRGLVHLAETYVNAAAPALRKQGAEERDAVLRMRLDALGRKAGPWLHFENEIPAIFEEGDDA
jgi:hypothetical protein